MADNYDSVLRQLQDAGLILDGPIRLGKIVRCKVEGTREKCGWYYLHEITGKLGDTLIVGSFGVWQGADSGARKVELDKSRELTPDQRAAIRKRLDDDRRAADRERAADARKASARASSAWAKLSTSGESKYLAKKGVLAHGLRFSAKGAIAIPVQDATGQIHGLEIIRDKADAEAAKKPAKQFWPPGMAKKGHFFLIGAPVWVVLIAEGYATAASLYEATGLPVAVAFDSGNLMPVAAELRKRYPQAKILLAADDDLFATHRSRGADGKEQCGQRLALDEHPKDCPGCGKPHERINTGVTAASSAGVAITNAAWLKPVFADDVARRELFARRGMKLTDFNDLHAAESIAAVRAQVEGRLSDLQWSPRSAARLNMVKRGEGRDAPLRPINSYTEVLERFSLVYGMGSVVFDAQEHRLVALSDMRDACIRKDVHRVWSESPERRIVRENEVGFDPTERAPGITCNLWAGWPTVPKAGSCQRLLDLLRFMCSVERNASGLYDWVIKWLAYPLQRPGAKMKSTIVLHGKQGTGKNLFFEAYMGIFGMYADVIDQVAIEDKFNDWASRKLFLIADEVVARSDLYHVKNKLKGLITGNRIRINPKGMSGYFEANHVNLVFLSNETIPVVLEEDDRRHCVIWTPEKLDKSVYRAILAEIGDGGIAALHDYLLHLDLGDFDVGTDPPESEAKDELINQSMDSTSRFWYELERGDLVPGKLGPALSSDVYRLYRGYCVSCGLRAAPLPKLVNVLKRKHGVTDARKRYFKGMQEVGPAGLLYLGDLEQPLDLSEKEWLGQCVTAFGSAVNDYLGADRNG